MNTFNFYQNKMSKISAQNGVPVPNCYSMYHTTLVRPFLLTT